MQTAAIRSFLEPEYHFEFVEGRWPHLEGNWSVHTTDFSKSKVSDPVSLPTYRRPSSLTPSLKLYGYYNGLDINDVLATENELREIIAEHGPFDGILGYSYVTHLDPKKAHPEFNYPRRERHGADTWSRTAKAVRSQPSW